MEKKVFCHITFLYHDILKHWITNIKRYEIAKYIYIHFIYPFLLNNILLVFILTATIMIASPMLSVYGANGGSLDIEKATVTTDPNEIEAILKTHGHISTNGDDGAFGYGVLTKEGLDAVIVSTTHKGVKDSEEQKNKNDPVWHNHFVKLSENSKECGKDLKVEQITFQSPGNVNINEETAKLTDIPSKFTGTDALSKDKLTLKPGTDVKDVVSFKLDPKFDNDGELEAVCVTHVQSADDVVVN
jgi:hypothetical protein